MLDVPNDIGSAIIRLCIQFSLPNSDNGMKLKKKPYRGTLSLVRSLQ